MRKEEREEQREKGKDGGRELFKEARQKANFFFILKRGKVNSRTKKRKDKQQN